MSIEYFLNSLYLIKPEIAVTIFLVLIVLLDLFFSKKNHLLPFFAFLGLLITGYFVIEQFDIKGLAFVTNDSRAMVTVDSFAAFFKTIVVITSLYFVLLTVNSKEMDETHDRRGEYYTLMMGMVLGMFFMISGSDLILLYLSVELVSLSSYVMAGFAKTSERSSEASLKYLIYGALSSGLMLFGISLVYGLTASTNLYELNALIVVSQANSFVLMFALLLIFAGIGYKISAVPFHFWTPDVYEGAPTPVTAYLSVASKAAGFALLIRFIKVSFVFDKDTLGFWSSNPVFNWQDFLIVISVATMTLGNFAALWQKNVKRMLAYSSIAHAGYLLTGLAVLSDTGLIAILVYFAIYLMMNIGAFLIVILIKNKTGSEELDNYDGLGFSMPFLGVSFTIFLISLTGLPPTAGFIGKLYLFMALVDAKMIVLAVIALLNSVVSLYYYIRILKHMFLAKPKENSPKEELSLQQILIVLSLVIPVIFFGLYFSPIVELAKNSILMLGF
ncbi:MAG: NADH-quinone oxidoreductase subunit N [Ignavibacteria bacterium]|jgi:NADH-quinone oxidoreductase subunit N|nr:NADH-quinone oxidoreductase subunit N [Ignavibacteria bacterium]